MYHPIPRPEIQHLFDVGDLPGVISRCEKFIEKHRVAGGNLTAELGLEYEAIALARLGMTNYAEASRFANEALNIQRATLGATHPCCAKTLNILGICATRIGNEQQAQRLYREALDILDRLSVDDQDLFVRGNVLVNLAINNGKRGEYKHAEKLLLLAVKARFQCYGYPHPQFGMVFTQLGYLYRNMGNLRAAERAAAKGTRFSNPHTV